MCLSAAFKFVNRVTDCYKSQCEPYDELCMGPRRLMLYLQTLGNNKAEGKRTFDL